MLEKQPNRPDETLFIGAARRFLKGEYPSEPTASYGRFFTPVSTVYPGKNIDATIIRQEWAADGLLGEYEPIADFALRQLRIYE